MMQWLKLELEVLTPAFISGANQQEAELRSASIRGLLRWWWRASTGHQHTDVGSLRKSEAALFGGADEKLKSPVSVVIDHIDGKSLDRGKELPKSRFKYTYRRQGETQHADVLPYLAYGPVRPLKKDEKMGGHAVDPAFNGPDGRAKTGPLLIRPAFDKGSTFQVQLSWRRAVLDETQKKQLVEAACAWVTLGGIGSRSRKGYGHLDGGIVKASSEEFCKRAREWWVSHRRELLRDGPKSAESKLPPFPQLAYRRLIRADQCYGRWEDALGALGKCYKEQVLPKLGEAGLRWLAGRADPRRASSILLSVIREGQNYRGLLCILPCSEGGRGETRADPTVQQALKAVAAIRCKADEDRKAGT